MVKGEHNIYSPAASVRPTSYLIIPTLIYACITHALDDLPIPAMLGEKKTINKHSPAVSGCKGKVTPLVDYTLRCLFSRGKQGRCRVETDKFVFLEYSDGANVEIVSPIFCTLVNATSLKAGRRHEVSQVFGVGDIRALERSRIFADLGHNNTDCSSSSMTACQRE